jgi:hypothetical protein
LRGELQALLPHLLDHGLFHHLSQFRTIPD